MAKPIQKISWSEIKQFRRCQRAWSYKYEEQLVPIKKPQPLYVGGLIHDCLQAHYSGKDWKEQLENKRREFYNLYDDMEEDLPAIVEGIITRYLEHYKKDPLKVQKVEFEIDTKITSKIRVRGYIDALVKDKEGRLWIMERKSHKTIPNADARYLDLQTVLYMWLYQRQTGETPYGIIWDYLRTKLPTVPRLLKSGELSKAKSIDTDYKTYFNEIKKHNLNPKDYEELLFELQTTGRYFERVKLPHPSKALTNSTTLDFMATAEEIVQIKSSNRPRVRNLMRDCTGCQYFSICNAERLGYDSTHIRKKEYQTKDRNRKPD